eukprot:7389028-Prymnesium_polylepis.1
MADGDRGPTLTSSLGGGAASPGLLAVARTTSASGSSASVTVTVAVLKAEAMRPRTWGVKAWPVRIWSMPKSAGVSRKWLVKANSPFMVESCAIAQS